MNIKKKYVLLGLLLLTAAWLGNIFYYQKHVLKEPLFIKHYYDVKQGMDSFRLYYIDNINQKNEVAYISFPEIEEGYTSTEIWQHNSDNRYYNFKIINVRTNGVSDGNIPENLINKVITKAIVYLNNGKSFDVDIGKIYLYNDRSDERILHSIRTMGSSNNTGSTTFTSPAHSKIYGVSTKFPELMDGMLNVSINDIPLEDVKFPINVNMGDNITVNYGFKFDRKDINRNNAYEFSIDLLTENSVGEKGVNSAFVDYWLQSPEEFDIAAMLKDRGNE